MVSGGGTGGHIFPAIAIADALKKLEPNSEFLFVGAKDRMEMQRVPQAGYKIEGLWISGIQRKLTLSNLAFPFKLLSSLLKSKRLIKRFKPDAVIGTGGFASGPLLQIASSKGIPTLIQEQNSYPGITNKILSKKVNAICVAYDKMERFFPLSKILLTGNPVRNNINQNIGDKKALAQSLNLDTTKPTLLILGGSLGARKINELISNNLESLLAKGINIIWQTGQLYIDTILEKHNTSQGKNLKIQAFIKDMNEAYGVADYVISRAGAGTISELGVVKKATLLIPSPNVAEDHQTKNALALVEKDAALLFKEQDTGAEFLSKVNELISKKNQLQENIAQLGLPNAAEDIAKEVLKLISTNAR